LKQPGEWVSADEVVAEIIDPLTDMIQSVRPQVGGLIYASRRAPFVTFGAEVMKIVGKQPYAGGGGWRCKTGGRETSAIGRQNPRRRPRSG
jgi:hypothetical protein